MAQQLFNIQDDKVVINKLALRYLEGSIIHAGSFDVVGNASIQNNLVVNGSITVDTINVKNIVTDKNKQQTSDGNWATNTENELENQGFSWSWGTGATYLSYQVGNRIWTNGNIDLDSKSSYMIGNTAVLSLNELAPQVTKSRLKEVGPLKSLYVSGDSVLGDVAYVNSSLSRVGINTDQPNGSLSVVDNGAEFIIDSPNFGSFNIGTFTNNDVTFVTDNTPRFSIKNNGDVIFGNNITKSANVTIYGSLKVDNIVSDTRIDRYSSLEFRPSREQPIYGLGLSWFGEGGQKRLVMKENPDRLWTTESFDLQSDKAYYINGNIVLSAHELGLYVTKSNLKSVGALESLHVDGESHFVGNMTADSIKLNTIMAGSVSISQRTIDTTDSLSVVVSADEVFYADTTEIAIGNKLNNRRTTKVYGQLTVGVNTPDPSVKLEVAGDVRFNNKKFVTGTSMPTDGTFNVGDICWNQNPTVGNYVGWVCTVEGAPGMWAPFGLIS